jgi:putative SOS response-associated peptidase YedK
MCGRFFILANPAELADLFQLANVPDTAPPYNIAPTQSVLTIGADRAGLPAAAFCRWGLVAPWASDAKPGPINARSETVADKPTFAEPIRKRRCLIPASGFYEWLRRGKAKQPYAFRLADDRPFAFAGLWERWEGPDGPVETCCILTTEANELVRPAHDRMPVMLERPNFEQWLDPAEQDTEALGWMLRPYRADAMRAYPVSPLVNNPKNDDARCIEPA